VDYERLLVDNLSLVDGVVRTIARRYRLSADDADELCSSVRLKLLENDYEVLRKFEQRSQLRTYLITVVQRVVLDDRNARWGKWRPSAQAYRLGPIAILLDELITRDHRTLDEAAESISARFGDAVSRSQLEAMLAQLPARRTRRFVGDEVLEQMPAPAPDEGDVLDSLDRERCGDRIERALESVLTQLGDEDRVILRMRFCHNMKLARIAEMLALAPKPFYRRVDDLMRMLRQALQAQGVTEADVTAVLASPLAEIDSMLAGMPAEKSQGRPSVP
jgi:RNA polymerase sigma factor (sigma-70 family)